MGFQVDFEFVNYPLQPSDWKFYDTAAVFAATNELYINGLENSFYVTTAPRKSVTPEQRQLMAEWLAHQPNITDLQVGALSDAWYITAKKWQNALPHEMAGRIWNRQ
jgi:uncharacterized protein YggL (DUF469 family)